MSNLDVGKLKRLFPKNTAHRKGGKANGANRKRVQVMLPPDTLARLDELIEHDQQARSAAVALGVELLYVIVSDQPYAFLTMGYTAKRMARLVGEDWVRGAFRMLAELANDQP